MVVVTLDRDGMALYHRQTGGALFPTAARAVYDITGAGDMVLAALGVFLGGGASPEAALQLANAAAGLEVEQVGVVAISRAQLRQRVQQGQPPAKIVGRDEAARLADQYRQAGKRVVFTNGCFDLLHAGHVLSLAAARGEGDVLFVGVNSDDVIRRLKGPQRPIIGQQDRMAVLAALACVDHVVLFQEETPHELLRAIRPHVLVKGGTYSPEQVVGREVVEAYGGTVRVTPIVDGLSTSHIVETVLQKSAA
jgi:D-beta-D-heptose 7-phosphate kinase/D-beta-D-heptose 1-phosphate adenosyltransferase